MFGTSHCCGRWKRYSEFNDQVEEGKIVWYVRSRFCGCGGWGGRWHWLTIVFMVDFVVTALNMSILQLESYANCLLLDQLLFILCAVCMKGKHLAEFMSVCPSICPFMSYCG